MAQVGIGPPTGTTQIRTFIDSRANSDQRQFDQARVHAQCRVLILDEPTAALDARAEYEVFQRFRELSAARSAVLISHRFSSVRIADRIMVLADGRVEASGTNDALLAAGGRYAELFELQAAGYR